MVPAIILFVCRSQPNLYNILSIGQVFSFCCGSLLPVFGVESFGDVSPYVCSYYFSSVSNAEWPSFWK